MHKIQEYHVESRPRLEQQVVGYHLAIPSNRRPVKELSGITLAACLGTTNADVLAGRRRRSHCMLAQSKHVVSEQDIPIVTVDGSIALKGHSLLVGLVGGT